jgi:hypothetical protein
MMRETRDKRKDNCSKSAKPLISTGSAVRRMMMLAIRATHAQ